MCHHIPCVPGHRTVALQVDIPRTFLLAISYIPSLCRYSQIDMLIQHAFCSSSWKGIGRSNQLQTYLSSSFISSETPWYIWVAHSYHPKLQDIFRILKPRLGLQCATHAWSQTNRTTSAHYGWLTWRMYRLSGRWLGKLVVPDWDEQTYWTGWFFFWIIQTKLEAGNRRMRE